MDNFDDESEEILDETESEYEPDFIYLDQFIPVVDDSNIVSSPASPDGSGNDSQRNSASDPPSAVLDQEQLKKLNEFSLENHTKELSEKAGTGDLLTSLYKHWQVFVPICFTVSDNPMRNLVENEMNRVLFKPLEVYICNNLNSDTILGKLRELDDPPQLCGKVFKSGEPSYFCRDCGSDPTCVLCSKCFLRSKHREHRYKMMTSGGGGYCDCGDPEAWKQHPNCELHMPKSEEGSDESPESFVKKLPSDLVQRATQLFSYLFDYMFEMLSMEDGDQLPIHLRAENSGDDYVTMLYNDEVHSYEQVVNTLRKVLSIDDKRALEYASVVDKEGRSAIKRGKNTDCLSIKDKIERTMGGAQNNPLATKVHHHSLVCHQYFAERIAVWLKKICEYSKGLKQILCKIGMFAKPDSHSVVEKLMLSDTILWKSARSIIHKFFIAVYFMDPEWKREFAVLYSRNYKLIWSNYVKNPDDAVSLTDLAVQMFTVISLSKYLITKENLLQTIMDTLIDHSKTNKGKLSFPRTRSNNSEFKRAQFMLLDIKYCLTVQPDEWSDELRRNFINGFKSFVQFIKFMHGMDSVVRQTQQHLEYEPEWETSFNLLIKLQKSIMSIVEWCYSDREVYLECVKYLLHVIGQVEGSEAQFKFKYDKVKFNGSQFEVIDYSVLRQEVSIHAPLNRLLAALYPGLSRFGLSFATAQFNTHSPLSSLKHDLSMPKMLALLEPSIRSLILVSQTNSGLWKRNGFSLLSQVYFYGNIKCRHEMFDRDLLCLQMGASTMDPNEFLTNLLVHFNLFDYFTDEDFDPAHTKNFPDELRQSEFLLAISEDFLELLIQIVGERFDAELSASAKETRLEREVIHQLCISPMPHSDLVKNIYPDNEKYTNDLESVLSRVANFKSAGASSSAKGVYELREEYMNYYSPYFYHYSRSERTKSEEYQLSLRKAEKEKFFKPSRLPALNALFANITHLLDCDVFVRLVSCILRRINAKCKFSSEGQLARVLYLIGMALYEEQDDLDRNISSEEKNYSFKFLEKSALNSRKSAAKSLKTDDGLVHLLSEVSAHVAEGQCKLLATWTLELAQHIGKLKHKLEQQQQKQEVGAPSTSVEKMESESLEEAQREKRKNLVAEKRRAKVLAQLNQMQKNFITKNKELYEETKTTSVSASAESSISECMESTSSAEAICIGPNRINPLAEAKKKQYNCILCQEESEISMQGPPMVLCSYVQSSKVLSKNRIETIDSFDKFDPLFVKSSLYWGINATSCGHVMHASCWQKYVDTVKSTESRRHNRYHGFSVKRNEYLCPLCETIGNCVLPIFPEFKELCRSSEEASKSDSEGSKREIKLSYEDWIDGLEKTLENCVKKELQDDKDVFIINPCPLSTITRLMADTVANNFKSLFEFNSLLNESEQKPLASLSLPVTGVASELKLSDESVNLMENFSKAAFQFGFGHAPVSGDEARMQAGVWSNCSYTIQVIEQLLRVEAKSLFAQFTLKQSELLSSIVKQAALYSMTKSSESARQSCVRLLAALLPYKTVLFDSKNLMELDMFSLLVFLSLSMVNLYEQPKIASFATSLLNDFNIFKLVLQAHCVQIFLSKIKRSSFVTEMKDESASTPSENELKVYEFYEHVLKVGEEKGVFVFKTGAERNALKHGAKIVMNTLRHSLMPFLRCSALFFGHLTDITPSSLITSDDDDLEENFDRLLRFLGVSNGIGEILSIQSDTFTTILNSWLSNAAPLSSLSNLIDYPYKADEFIELPQDFVDLMSMSMTQHSCSTRSSMIGDNSETATILCLICGEMLCSQTYCCQQEIGNKRLGSCAAHTYKCGATVGVFLRVAECQILLLHFNYINPDDLQVRGCFVPAPYLDNYGETDQGLRRGNPLRLNKARYQKLYKDWLSHAIPDEVTRSYQNQANIIHMDWIQF